MLTRYHPDYRPQIVERSLDSTCNGVSRLFILATRQDKPDLIAFRQQLLEDFQGLTLQIFTGHLLSLKVTLFTRSNHSIFL
jgi:hypothetical protein